MIAFIKKHGYVFAVALMILVLFCGYFAYSFSAVNTALMQEKLIDRTFETNLICSEIDYLISKENDWGIYDYQSFLSQMISQIDATVTSYAELFDENLNNLSVRSPLFKEKPFDPKNYPELLQAVEQNERGEIIIDIEQGNGISAYTNFVYYRWVPTDKALSNRMLVLVGVSKHSVDTEIPALIEYGAIALIIVSSIFIIGATILFCRLRVYAGGGKSGKE